MADDRQLPLRSVSLFSGIAGLDIGLSRAGIETIAFSEIEPNACKILGRQFPDIPNLGDIAQIDWTPWRGTPVISGGFPCQGMSNAGKRLGFEDPRSALWKEYLRAIREVGPRYVIVENVPGLTARGLDVVLGDLADCGMDAAWQVLPACAFGAPHERRRLFLVAYTDGPELRIEPWRGGWKSGQGTLLPGFDGPTWDAPADADGERREARRTRTEPVAPEQPWTGRDAHPSWGAPPPAIRGVDDGIPPRLDAARRHALGNAVVPAVAEHVGRIVVDHYREAVGNVAA